MKRSRMLSPFASNGISVSVVKAFSILDALASKGKDGASLTEIAEHLQVSKSTAHRYLTTLERLGTVEHDERDRFRLGIKLVELAGVILRNNDLRNQSEAILNELAAQTQETIHLGVPSETEVVYIAKIDSSHSIQMRSSIGGRVPMHCTALGKAILAYAPSTLVEQVIHQGLTRRTPRTITSPETLRAELERVRAQGFSVDLEENEAGVCCVGAPVFNHDGKVIGAISISGPAQRLIYERCIELGPLVREAAQRVSRRMGYSFNG